MPHLHSSLRRALAAAAGTVLVVGVLTSAAAARPTARTPIAGTHPAWATPSARLSQQPAGAVTASVYLAGQDPAGLAAYVSGVSTPGNALYSHYLTAAQVMSRYGPTKAEVSAVTGWLTGAGLTVTNVVDRIGGYLQVRGTLQQAGQAFDVTFGTFRSQDNQAVRAPEQTASAPADLAGDVLDVNGLDTATHLMKPADTLPPPGPNYWTAPPCSQYYGQKIAVSEPSAYGTKQPYTNCGYAPRQLRSAYHVAPSGMTGKGQTVAIVDAYASPTILSDADTYARVTGDQPFRPGQFTQHLAGTYSDTGTCDASGWYSEESIDVESVHGLAPDADVTFVSAASCTDSDLIAALALIVSDHLASIVSVSWEEPYDDATLVSTYNEVFEAGAAEGIGFFFASGDNGYESPAEDPGTGQLIYPGSDQIQVTWPPASPYVTAVGGTSLAIDRAGQQEWETSWGTVLDPLSASGMSWEFTPPGEYPQYYGGSGGGGVSMIVSQPWYQRGVVPRKLATSLPDGATSASPMRVVPDVSALADPSTGILVGQTDLQPDGTSYAFSLSRVGGTSVACPVWAGIEADAQQAAGHPLGFANPAIYQRYGTSALHDVTDHPLGPGYLGEVRDNYTDPDTKTGPIVSYLRTLGIDGEGAAALPAVRGYDDATGVGSPGYYIQSFRH